jgi:hypothetical protein
MDPLKTPTPTKRRRDLGKTSARLLTQSPLVYRRYRFEIDGMKILETGCHVG